jgi:2EXR family
MTSTSTSFLEPQTPKTRPLRKALSMRMYTMSQVISLQRRGCYHTEVEDGKTLRTLLLDFLEDSPRCSKQQLAPVIRYFEQILESCKNSKLRSFTLFPRLPTEIRQMIWKYALPGERIFEVFYRANYFPRLQDLRASNAPLLQLISVNREALSVALQDYRKLRIKRLNNELVHWEKEFYLLVNYETDIFYFSKIYMSALLMEKTETIKRLVYEDTFKIGIIAFDMLTFNYLTIRELNPPCLHCMSNLRELLFIQNRRKFLADTDQQDSGRPLFCTRSKERDESFSKLYPRETAAIDETLAIPKIAEIYKNIRTSFVIFRQSVL